MNGQNRPKKERSTMFSRRANEIMFGLAVFFFIFAFLSFMVGLGGCASMQLQTVPQSGTISVSESVQKDARRVYVGNGKAWTLVVNVQCSGESKQHSLKIRSGQAKEFKVYNHLFDDESSTCEVVSETQPLGE